MSRYWPIETVILMLAWTWTGAHGATPPPHMLIYLSDDHGMRDCSPYGARDIPTPEMEKLAATGMLFTQAYVASPSCAPSRAAMLTGLMPARNGAEANHSYPRPDVRILIQDLKGLGYEVVAFGKVAHGSFAERCGFDIVDRENQCDQLRAGVTEYLSRRTSRKPLCLFVGTSNPHVAWSAVTRFHPDRVALPPTHLDTPETRRHRTLYYEEIAELDELLGDLRSLAARYLGDNTFFMYTSDHGAQWPFGKWNLYDAGIRTPLIASWPGHIAPGSCTDARVSWVDLLPTLIDLAGGETPPGCDGLSFAEILRGEKTEHRRRIFTTHSGDGNKNIYPIRAVSHGNWKYILNLHPEYAHTNHSDLLQKPRAGAYWTSWIELAEKEPRARATVDRYFQRPAEELYHVVSDPHEQINLAGDTRYDELKKDLRRELEKWMIEQGDRRSVFNKPRPLNQPDTWKPGYVRVK
jgi:arylsulfatase A-like enzyme